MQIETEFSDSAQKLFSQLQLQLESCENGPMARNSLARSFFFIDKA